MSDRESCRSVWLWHQLCAALRLAVLRWWLVGSAGVALGEAADGVRASDWGLEILPMYDHGTTECQIDETAGEGPWRF